MYLIDSYDAPSYHIVITVIGIWYMIHFLLLLFGEDGVCILQTMISHDIFSSKLIGTKYYIYIY